MIVLVCGGRDYNDYTNVFRTLYKIYGEHGITLIVHGGATGADSLAEKFAKEYEIPSLRVPAQWKKFGVPAGPIRNAQMLDFMGIHPDLVVAFPGGPGTANMVKLARNTGIGFDILVVPERKE